MGLEKGPRQRETEALGMEAGSMHRKAGRPGAGERWGSGKGGPQGWEG